jgi:hypothetical protein
MPYSRQAEVILANWREAERQLADLRPDSATADLLRAESARLRDEYQALIEAARSADSPEPPPFPSGVDSG